MEPLDLDDDPELVVIECYVTSARRAYRYADHYRARGAYVCLGGLHPTSLPDEAAAHADSVFCGPGEDIWPAFLRGLPGRPAAPAVPLDGAHARRRSAAAPRPDPPRALPRAQLDGGQPRLPACVRLLLQGVVLPRRSVLLPAGGRRGPGRDRAPARPPPVLPRRQPLRQPAVRRGAVRRPARHGPRVAGGGHRAGGAAARPAGEGRGLRAAQPVRRLREPESRPICAAQHKLQNLGGGYDDVVRRLHELGVMVNAASCSAWTRTTTMCSSAPSEWAVSRGIETATFHILTPYPGTPPGAAPGGRGPHHQLATGIATTRGTPCSRPRHMTARQLEDGYRRRLPRLLQLAQHRARRLDGAGRPREGQAPGLHRGLEEARAAVGRGHPQRSGTPLPAAAGGHPGALRQRRRRHAARGLACAWSAGADARRRAARMLRAAPRERGAALTASLCQARAFRRRAARPAAPQRPACGARRASPGWR